MPTPTLFVRPQLGREAHIVDRTGRHVATVHAAPVNTSSADLAAQMASAPLLAQALDSLMTSLAWHVARNGAVGMDAHRLTQARELLMLTGSTHALAPRGTPTAADSRALAAAGPDSAWDLPGYDH